MDLAQPPPVVPPGYHFQPTPEELVRCYLNPWVTTGGQADFHGVVCAADIYAADPDTLTSRFARHDHGGNWYFLCVARWKEENKDGEAGKRMNRRVRGGGTWHSSAKRKPIGEGEGYRHGFEYREAGDKKTEWLMDEYVTYLKAATDGEGVRVLCRVHRSLRKHGPDEEEETNNKQVVVSTKRLRRLYGEHGVAACSVLVVPSLPPDEQPRCYDYAGTSYQLEATDELRCYDYDCAGTSYQLEATAASTTSWQQSMMEQGIVGCYGPSGVNGGGIGVFGGHEPGPSVAVVENVSTSTKDYDGGEGGEQEPWAASESVGTDRYWILKEGDVLIDSIDADALMNEWMDLSTFGDNGGTKDDCNAGDGGEPAGPSAAVESVGTNEWTDLPSFGNVGGLEDGDDTSGSTAAAS